MDSRRFSQTMFERSTGINVSGHYTYSPPLFQTTAASAGNQFTLLKMVVQKGRTFKKMKSSSDYEFQSTFFYHHGVVVVYLLEVY